MDPLSSEIRAVLPNDPDVVPLLEHHVSLMRASSPSCSVHAMDADRLLKENVAFFAAFEGTVAVAIGGLKRLSGDHGEIKSMHVAEASRGCGLARAMLARLLEVARVQELERISLETGSQDAFAPARAFYAREGFAPCPPFADYEPDPNSVFMTRMLSPRGGDMRAGTT
ncbi:MAG: GNAT family N-acetyltransferase [Pseudomonadota bacterium]